MLSWYTISQWDNIITVDRYNKKWYCISTRKYYYTMVISLPPIMKSQCNGKGIGYIKFFKLYNLKFTYSHAVSDNYNYWFDQDIGIILFDS